MNAYQQERLSSLLNGELGDLSDYSSVQSFGIGLMISNQIAIRLSRLKRENGGGIQFSSTLGKGSTFSFMILDNYSELLERKQHNSIAMPNTPKKVGSHGYLPKLSNFVGLLH